MLHVVASVNTLTKDKQDPEVGVIWLKLIVRTAVFAAKFIRNRVGESVKTRALCSEQLVSHDDFTITPQKLKKKGYNIAICMHYHLTTIISVLLAWARNAGYPNV